MTEVTSITPQSIKADNEPERKLRTFRVLARSSAEAATWLEMASRFETPWSPTAEDVGEQFGEGDFLLIENDDRYDFKTVYPLRVVAEKHYREAREGE